MAPRELTLGSRHFNELRRGVPRMSPTLLSKRLNTLVRAGVVDRWDDGGRIVYQLTPAGRELEPIVAAVGSWGVRWMPELGKEDDCPPATRHWWIVVNPDEVDVCDVDPGFDVRVTIEASLRAMIRLWRGDWSWRDAQRSGELSMAGEPHARRAVTS